MSQSISKYLFSAYRVLGIVLRARDIKKNKTDVVPTLKRAFKRRQTIYKQTKIISGTKKCYEDKMG